jgi:ABC-2 type transport system permease protein
MRKALAVGRKEFRQIVRDRRSLTILLFIPVFFLLLYGYALNFDIKHVGLAVEDRDGSAESRSLLSAFVNSGYFDLVATVYSDEVLDRLMDQNRVRAALVIPEGLGRAMRTGEHPTVQVIVNGDNATAGATIMGYALAIVRSMPGGLQAARGAWPPQAGPVSAEPRIWYNPELRSALFLVPGLIAFIVMITGAISTAMSIVREKERGTWEQVRMAPLSTVSYVVGKTIPYLVISLFSAIAIFAAAMALFDLPMRGSWFTLLLSTLLFAIGALGTGLLVSTLVESQVVAFQVVLLLAFLPTFILSGFVFPISSMPVPIQVVTHIVPARYFLVALRGIVLKGVGIATIWPQLVAMVIYLLVTLGLASVRLAKAHG